jgi:hypothetical protein
MAQILTEGTPAMARVLLDLDERTEDIVSLIAEQGKKIEGIEIPTQKDYDEKLEEEKSANLSHFT